MKNSLFIVLTFCITFVVNSANAALPTTNKVMNISNEHITYSVTVNDGKLSTATLALNNNAEITRIITDADFSLEIVWADWLPPGKDSHGDNPAILTK